MNYFLIGVITIKCICRPKAYHVIIQNYALKLEQNVLLREISLLIKYHQTLSIDAHSLTSLQYSGKIHGKVKNYSGNLIQ